MHLELDFLGRFDVKFKFKYMVGRQFLPSGTGVKHPESVDWTDGRLS